MTGALWAPKINDVVDYDDNGDDDNDNDDDDDEDDRKASHNMPQDC